MFTLKVLLSPAAVQMKTPLISLSPFLSTVCLEIYCVAVKIYFELLAALIPFIHAYTWASISTATLCFSVSPTFFASMYLFLFRKLSRQEK